MPKLLLEERLGLSELANEQGIDKGTPWRWATRGVKGVKLETYTIGGRRFTTREAFGRFVERTSNAARLGAAS